MSLEIPEDCMFCIMGAGAIIEKREDETDYVLLQRRIDNINDYQNGLFEIPCGKVKKEHSVFDVIRRRVTAETGLKVTKIIGEPKQNYSDVNYNLRTYIPYCTVQNIDDIYPVSIDFFLCNVEGDPLSRTKDAYDIHWYEISNVAKLIKENYDEFFPMVREALFKYLSDKGIIL